MAKKRTKKKPAKSSEHVHQKVSDDQIKVALVESRGLVAAAARALGITSRAIYYRMEQSPGLSESLKESREVNLDVAEAKLFQAIEKGEAWAICFYLKCQAKGRGYVEKTEVAVNANVEHSGTIGIREVADQLRSDPRWREYSARFMSDRHARLLRDGSVGAAEAKGREATAAEVAEGASPLDN